MPDQRRGRWSPALLPILTVTLLRTARQVFYGHKQYGVQHPVLWPQVQQAPDAVAWVSGGRGSIWRSRPSNVQMRISLPNPFERLGAMMGTSERPIIWASRASVASVGQPEVGNETDLTREVGVRQLKALSYDGYEIRAVARVNEQVRSHDPVGLHGFVVLALEDREDRQQFARLDFGVDGYALQLGVDLQTFQAYRLLPSTLITHGTRGSEIPTAGLFRGELLASPTAGGGAPAKDFLGLEVPTWLVHNTQFAAARPGALGSVVRLLSNMQDTTYDLCDFNCNHLADRVVLAII